MARRLISAYLYLEVYMHRILAFSALILFACACAYTSPTPALVPAPIPTQTTSKDESYSGGLRTLFVSEPSQLRGIDKRAPYFQVEAGDALRGELGLVNEFPDVKDVVLILMLNYKQSLFAVEQNDLAATYLLTLEPGQEIHLHVRTQSLPTAFYDVAWVFVVDPDNLATDTLARARSEFVPINRSNVYVGNTLPSTPQFTAFEQTQPDPDSHYAFLFSLEQTADSFDLWPEVTVPPDTPLHFFVRFGVERTEVVDSRADVPIALVGFLDNHQVKINAQDVIFGLARQGKITTVPITIQAPHEPGPHLFFIHRFPHPFVQIGTSSIPFQSLATQRVLIHVSPN